MVGKVNVDPDVLAFTPTSRQLLIVHENNNHKRLGCSDIDASSY